MTTPERQAHRFSTWGLGKALCLIALLPAGICAFLHLRAPLVLAADGVTWLHGATAVLANFFGPWAGPLVRLVDFPNAGLRSFNLPLALALTLLLAAVLYLTLTPRRRAVQIALLMLFVPVACGWFLSGLLQIADGLL